MADAVLDDGKCLLPNCSNSGLLSTFKLQAVKKLIMCATERYDDETRNIMHAILDSQGEQAFVKLLKTVIIHSPRKIILRNLWLGRGRPVH